MADRRWPRWVYGVGEEPDPRFSLANERTYLAWIRTGLGFIAAGMAIAALAHYLAVGRVVVRAGSALLVGAGVLTGVVAFLRWMQQERAMRLNQTLASSGVLPLLTVVLIIVAVLVLTLFL